MANSVIEVEEMAKTAAAGRAVSEVKRLFENRFGMDLNGDVATAATQAGAFDDPDLDSEGNPISYWTPRDAVGSKPVG